MTGFSSFGGVRNRHHRPAGRAARHHSPIAQEHRTTPRKSQSLVSSLEYHPAVALDQLPGGYASERDVRTGGPDRNRNRPDRTHHHGAKRRDRCRGDPFRERPALLLDRGLALGDCRNGSAAPDHERRAQEPRPRSSLLSLVPDKWGAVVCDPPPSPLCGKGRCPTYVPLWPARAFLRLVLKTRRRSDCRPSESQSWYPGRRRPTSDLHVDDAPPPGVEDTCATGGRSSREAPR